MHQSTALQKVHRNSRLQFIINTLKYYFGKYARELGTDNNTVGFPLVHILH